MRRTLLAIVALLLFSTPAVSQQWDQVNGSMQVKSGPTAPLVIIDQTTAGQKILSLRTNGTEKCFVDVSGNLNCAGTFTLTGQMIGAAADNTATPPYSFLGDLNTGYASAAADTLSLVTGGTSRVSVSTTAVTSTVPLAVTAGTKTAPGIYGVGDPTTGLSGAGTGFATLVYSYSSVAKFWVSGAAASVALASDVALGWQSGTDVLVGGQDLVLSRLSANVLGFAAGDGWGLASVAVVNTAPTIASGFCTNPAISASNGTAAFTITIGTACAGSVGALTMPAATTGWVCDFANVTTPASNNPELTGGITTTATVTNYARTTGVAANWTDSEVLRVKCTAY